VGGALLFDCGGGGGGGRGLGALWGGGVGVLGGGGGLAFWAVCLCPGGGG